ncbi:hypothetical protein ES706_06233 [subsurface metagenome]|jgi:hypothetical protein
MYLLSVIATAVIVDILLLPKIRGEAMSMRTTVQES